MSNIGLNKDDLRSYRELLIKANYEQLKAVEESLIKEMNKRNKMEGV
jgi:hypothetical protein